MAAIDNLTIDILKCQKKGLMSTAREGLWMRKVERKRAWERRRVHLEYIRRIVAYDLWRLLRLSLESEKNKVFKCVGHQRLSMTLAR